MRGPSLLLLRREGATSLERFDFAGPSATPVGARGSFREDARADVDWDGAIGIMDLAIVGMHFRSAC